MKTLSVIILAITMGTAASAQTNNGDTKVAPPKNGYIKKETRVKTKAANRLKAEGKLQNQKAVMRKSDKPGFEKVTRDD
jgi:hypothetical protein